MTEAEKAFEDLDPAVEELLDAQDYVESLEKEADIKGGPIYDTEYGDSPPDNFYNGEGMYLGDGVWVGMDFFD